ncbi:MAG TPA: Crp/Fnr family transcriptional regulator [Geminicoccaceae bacterium]|nr:Crp/Fnr family transcriptional regulator [Geminicoccus sp.]HMU50658.1 Crp/Fnr family transcriptional regulator [Geminicoccaceae bacterium]
MAEHGHGGIDQWASIARHSGLTSVELELVRATPVFSGLSPVATVPLLEGAIAKPFARHSVLFLQGEPATRFFVVLDGWVRLYRQAPQGQEITIAVFSRGDSFAEAVVLQTMNFPVSGQAIADSRLLVIPADSFLRHLRGSTDLCLKVMAAMARRLQGLVMQLESVSSRPTLERLALFLLRLCDGSPGPCRIELPLDKNLIAARLGMQPETLSRCLAKLRRAGVESDGATLWVTEVARLRAIVAHSGDVADG